MFITQKGKLLYVSKRDPIVVRFICYQLLLERKYNRTAKIPSAI